MSRQPDYSRPPGKASERYERLARIREPFLRRARKCSELTIPTLLPPDGDVSGRKLRTPYQSVGAAGVNNLASKILLTLFPPNGRFFRMMVTQFELEQMVITEAQRIAASEGADPKQVADKMLQRVQTDAQSQLAAYERAVVQHYETQGNRPTDFEALKHLITAGNVLRYCPIAKDEKPRYYRLDQYVVKRDPDGKALEIITREGITPASIPEVVRKACDIPDDGDRKLQDAYDLFTRVVRDEDKKCWHEYQELNGVEIPGSYGKWPLDKCPWLPLRWSKIDGEDYGRGHVEEYLGDLVSLEGLSKAIVNGSQAAARLLIMVAPNGGTRVRDVAEAENGDVISGHANEVTFLQTNKFHDFRVAAETANDLKRSLGQAFLLTVAIQRDGERVTATEFNRLAHELEATLGGNYATLSTEYQLPLVELSIYSLQRQKKIPPLPKEIKPAILTGVQALGRNNDLERLMTVFDCVKRVPAPPAEASMYFKFADAYRQIATTQDIDGSSLFFSEEEVQQKIQAARQQAAQQQIVAAATPGITSALTQARAQGSPPTE